MTPAAIYLHFEDKNRLFFEVCNRRFAEFGTAVVAALSAADSVVEQLAALGRAYIRYRLEHPEGILLGDDPVPPAITLRATVHGYVQLVLVKEDLVPDVDVRAVEDHVLAQTVRGLLTRP